MDKEDHYKKLISLQYKKRTRKLIDVMVNVAVILIRAPFSFRIDYAKWPGLVAFGRATALTTVRKIRTETLKRTRAIIIITMPAE